MAHYTQIDAQVSLLAVSGDLTAPTAATTATPLGQVATFDLTISKELLEATELGDDFRQYAQGVGEWSGTLTIHHDPATVGENQDELWEALLLADFAGSLVVAGAPGQIQVNFWIDSASGSGASKAFYGAMFVRSCSQSVGSGMSTLTVEVQGNGIVKFSKTLT